MEQPQNIRRQLQAMRLPLLMAAVAALLFTLPAQTTEIYRALAQTAVQTDWSKPAEYEQVLIELGLAASGILVLSVLLWFAARRAASIFQLRTQAAAGSATDVDFTTRPKLLLWLPRLILLAVPMAVASGILHSDVQPGFVDKVKDAMVDVFKLQFIYSGLSDEFASMFAADTASKILLFPTWLSYFAKLLLAGTGILFLVVFLLDRPWLARHLAKSNSWNSWVAVPVAAMAIGGVIATVLVYPVAIPQRLGALFIMSLFLIMVLLILLQLRTWRQKTGVPFVAIFLICALVFAVFDLNDNHSIRSLHGNRATVPHDEGLPNAFNRWLASRKDLDQYAGKPYPVYIVAAQGGGIYAATHAASFLGEVQDLCPGFGHHLFAISGVSGGSIGASVFAALTQDVDWANKPDEEKFRCAADVTAERSTPFQFATTSIFRQDLWSPLAASLLFPDFFQRFIFFPIHGWDRGRALEFALEDAYDKGVRESRFLTRDVPSKRPLTKSYMDHWNPEVNSHTPALLLNTTEVGSGKRRVVAPFSFPGIGLGFLPLWASDQQGTTVAPDLNPPLSTAAGLSARFPWLTPTAHFFENGKKGSGNSTRAKVRIADGAYFENSGVVTAIDLIKEIVATVRNTGIEQRLEIHLLVFTSAEFDVGGTFGLGEAMDPIRTMFNARAARAGIAVDEALEILTILSAATPDINIDMVRLELNGYGYPLPLGWRLSPLTEHLISYHNGSERFCSTEQASRTTAGLAARNASCAKRRIYDRLR